MPKLITGRQALLERPVVFRRNSSTTNTWVTATASAHNIFTSWYTPANFPTAGRGGATITDNGRFTAQVPGTYLVINSSYTTDSSNSSAYGYLNVYKNGSSVDSGLIANYGGATLDQHADHSVILYLNEGDYVQIGVYAVNTGFQYYSPNCQMMVALID